MKKALAYTAYGYLWKRSSALLGFNGEWKTGSIQAYPLGNGYRLYAPILMRFFSPDMLSPFGKGGLNTYCYCECDPVNNTDPSGHMKTGLTAQLKKYGIPSALKGGIKGYFKSNKATSFEFQLGKAYRVEKAPNGTFKVAEIETLEQLRAQRDVSQLRARKLEEQLQKLQMPPSLPPKPSLLDSPNSEREGFTPPIVPTPQRPPRRPAMNARETMNQVRHR